MSAEEITLRVARPEDAKALLAIYAPYVRDTAITFEYDVPSVEEFAGPRAFAISAPASPARTIPTPIRTTTACSSTPTWASGWWAGLRNAAASSARGTTWYGWKSIWLPIRTTPRPSFPSLRFVKISDCNCSHFILIFLPGCAEHHVLPHRPGFKITGLGQVVIRIPACDMPAAFYQILRPGQKLAVRGCDVLQGHTAVAFKAHGAFVRM